ncbi:DUF317 domain-containing protein [Streptomyces sp. NPDC050844]|uniref:DUF317 domain-containing protein n=1 Tax=Streptomyces sp. NPDC050844 TaxID=3155790 RepID=UPI003407A5FF
MTDATSLSHRRVGEVEQAVAHALFAEFGQEWGDVVGCQCGEHGMGSERLWHAAATANTSAQILGTLLDALASESAWSAGPATGVAEATITHGLRPLGDADWKNTVDGRWISWDAPGEEPAGVHVDAFAAGMRPDSPLPTWTMWGGGNTAHQPAWTLELSSRTPAAVLYDLASELAEGQAVRRKHPTASGRNTVSAVTRQPLPSPPPSSPPSPSSPIRTR